MTKLGRLSILKMERDKLLRNLWSVFNQISNLQGLSMTDEDLDLWSLITNHSDLKNRLK